MKEINGKAKDSKNQTLKTGEDEIGIEFNKYFVDTSPSLAKNISNRSIPSESALKRVNTTLTSQSLSINELKDAFFFSENKQKSWC